MTKAVRSKLAHIGISLLTVVGIFAHPTNVHAADVTVTAVCNVTVTFKASVPTSVRQGESFTVSNIAISPSNSYGFTVSSSIYDFAATNTSSTTYHQNFVSTNPSPTTGHNTYWAYYPSWVVNATGAVGSSVVVTIKKSVTVVQGYGTVSCNFNKVFFSVPITAPASSPSPSPSQSASPSPTGGGGTKPSSSPSKSSTPKPGSPQQSQSPSVTATPTPGQSNTPEPSDMPELPTVVPLIVKVRDGSGNIVPNAEVTLNGTTKIKTDSKGIVKFENVLTGNHSLLVSYKGKSVSHTIYVDDQDVGTAMVISLPEDPLITNPFVIGGIAAGTLALGTPLAIFAVRRYKSRPGLNIPEGAIPLHGIASGAATPALAETKISHIPAIPMFDSQPVAVTPAPWESVPLIQPTPVATPEPTILPQQTPTAIPEQETAPTIILPQMEPIQPTSEPVPNIILPQAPPELSVPIPAAPMPIEPVIAPVPPIPPAETSTAGSIEAAISAQVAAPLPIIQKFAPMTPTAPTPVQTAPPAPASPPPTTIPVSIPVQAPPTQ